MFENISRRRLLQLAGVAGATSLVGGLGVGGFPRRAQAADLELVKPGSLLVAYNGDMPGTGAKDGKLIGLDGEIMQWIGE